MANKARRSRSITFRRSYQLEPSRVLLLDVGLWLIVGVFGLYESVRIMSGTAAVWVYLATGLLFIPALLSHIELRSWLGHHGGSYRLIRAMERPQLTFLAGWAYILGWAALSALIARLFAHYAGVLIGFIVPWEISRFALAGGLVAVFVLTNVLGYHPAWGLSSRLLGSTILVVILLMGLLLAGMPGMPMPVFSPVSGGGQFFAAVTALMACGWIVDIVSEVRSRHHTLRAMVLSSLGGPLLGGLLAAGGLWAAFSNGSPLVLPSQVLALGGPLFAGFGTLVTAIAWQVLALLMLRQLHSIGRDGLFSERLLRSYTRFKVPVLLILFQGVLPLAGIFLGSILDLAYLAAFAYLVLQVGVNVAAILLAGHPRAKDRPFVLPLYPVLPASGAAICFLLLFPIPPWITLLGLSWYVLGLLFYWQVVRNRIRTTRLGVTVFQDTTRRPDVTSEYPVVVPVANPDTAMNLVAFGAAIARQQGGHLLIVQVIQVPEQLPLDSARYRARQQLDLLERVLQEAESFDIPVEGVTRLARSISQGIVDTVTEESAKLCVMGWHARPQRPGQRGFGHILDEVLSNATCDMAIIRGDWEGALNRVLVPTSGGPHTPRAAEIALALTAGAGGEVTLLNVAQQANGEAGLSQGREIVEDLMLRLTEPERIIPRVVTADSPLTGILEAVQDQDAILLGVREPSFLDQPASSQLPVQVAQQTQQPLALVRNYAGLTSLVARKAWQSLADVLPTLKADEQMQVYRDMQRAAHPSINFFVLTALSALIATLGLLLNSPAVIIGAMLVAPLMSPIVAAATGIVFGDVRTLRSALTSTTQGVVAAIFIAILATLIAPLADATPEVLARTRPTLLDLMVAVFSGMAGAYAMARKEVSAALPGVAIAAALMPPVCAVGIGIALGQVGVAFGALLLFIANLVAIIFASAVTFLLLGIRPPRSPDRQRRLRQGLLIAVVSLLVISLPLGYILLRTIQQDQIERRALEIVRDETAEWGEVELVEFDVEYAWREVNIKGTLHTAHDITTADLQALDRKLEDALRPAVHVRLFIIEGTLLDSEIPSAE